MKLSDEQVRDLQAEWIAASRQAEIFLAWPALDVKEELGPEATAGDIMDATLDALKPLLEAGDLRAVEMFPDGSYAAWTGTPEEQLARIRARWLALGQITLGDHVPWLLGAEDPKV